ncbi:unnamed protein product [Linum trigynum]|uniref:Uncharacterized protein n=1 Tax=Linum trigynum TaxID=586398 RepID=A0AAV2F5D1_9ROSI
MRTKESSCGEKAKTISHCHWSFPDLIFPSFAKMRVSQNPDLALLLLFPNIQICSSKITATKNIIHSVQSLSLILPRLRSRDTKKSIIGFVNKKEFERLLGKNSSRQNTRLYVFSLLVPNQDPSYPSSCEESRVFFGRKPRSGS